MGGYTTFLHPGVDPNKIQGIVLNPMQQSEPSKVAILGMHVTHGIFGKVKKKLKNAGLLHLNMSIIIVLLKLKHQLL